MENKTVLQTSFHDKLQRLETIHNQLKELETNDLELLIALYQEGTILSKELNHTLNHFEQKIIEIDAIQIDTHIQDNTIDESPAMNIQEQTDIQEQDTEEKKPPEDKPPASTTASNEDGTPSNTITNYVADLFSDIE